jgi:alpha/beta superfamily hydrolase
MTPKDLLAVDFYLPTLNGEEALACSLYRSLEPEPTTSANTSTSTCIPTNVEGMGFDVDSRKPVVVICHGFMSWRNQMLLAHLAGGLQKRLNYHTLRFDFTGNGHSTGIFHHSNYNREFHDLQTVLSFVQDKMKCRVACVIGHSKGVGAVLRTAEEQESHDKIGSSSSRRTRIPCFVNMSGIFAVPHEYDIEKRLGVEKARVLKQNGRVVLDQKGARECVMTIDDVQERSNLDSSFVRNIKSAAVLTIHGSKDEAVPVSNAHEFAKTIARHELLIIEGADHNYNGLRHMQTMVNAVAKFVDQHAFV